MVMVLVVGGGEEDEAAGRMGEGLTRGACREVFFRYHILFTYILDNL